MLKTWNENRKLNLRLLKSDFTVKIHLHNKLDTDLDLDQTEPGSVLDQVQFSTWIRLDPDQLWTWIGFGSCWIIFRFSTCGSGPRGVAWSSLTLLEHVFMSYCSTFTEPLNYRNHLRPGSTQNMNLEQTRGCWFSLCFTVRAFQKFFIAETTTYRFFTCAGF